ncbi:hypothetical protein DCC79_11295, partial [bacterium]
MFRAIRFGAGLATGALLGGLAAWLVAYFAGVDSPEAFEARAKQLRAEPERAAARWRARVALALDEARRATAEAEASLQASRVPTPPPPRG